MESCRVLLVFAEIRATPGAECTLWNAEFGSVRFPHCGGRGVFVWGVAGGGSGFISSGTGPSSSRRGLVGGGAERAGAGGDGG